MSANLISLPFRPALNLSGTFESGARLTVYRADSTTLEPIFADSSLTVRLPNPVTADGFGIFPAIYYNEQSTVRVLLEQSDGTALFDLSPYISTVFEAENILDGAAQEAFNAASEAARAKASADAAALVEGTVEALVSPTYPSTSAGLAATSDGAFFAVVVGDVVTIYLNNNGTAVFQRSILSATAVQAALADKAALVHSHVITDVTGLQAALDAKAPVANPSLTGSATINGQEIGFRKIPRRSTTTTAVVADNGGCVALSAGITIPSGVFEEGHAVSFYNDSASSVVLTQGSGLTLRLAATSTTGDRTLAPRGMATIWFNSPTEAICSGSGVT